MGAQFLDLLKKVTIFMLAGQIIVQFLPSGGYEKYVKMMISIMVLSQIALPILSLGKFDAQQNFQTALRQYEEEMERISRQVEEAGLQSGDYQEEALSMTARSSLEEVSAQYGVTVTAVSRTEDGRPFAAGVGRRRAKGTDRKGENFPAGAGSGGRFERNGQYRGGAETAGAAGGLCGGAWNSPGGVGGDLEWVNG